MSNKFEMPPPNDFHENVSTFCLANLRSTDTLGSLGFRITDKLFWKSEPWRYATAEDAVGNHDVIIGQTIIPSDLLRPEVWCGDTMQELILQDTGIVALLEEAQAHNWCLKLRARLRGALLKLFDKSYFTTFEQDTNAWLADTFNKNPQLAFAFHDIDALQFSNGVRFILSPRERMSAKAAFEKHVAIVADWCMAHFSYHRELWVWLQKFEPLKLDLDAVSGEPDAKVRNYKKPRVSQAPPVQSVTREEQLAAMTPEVRQRFLAAEKTRKLALSLKRRGKLDDDLIDLIEE